MFCKNCGTELSDGARFCPNCGCDQSSGSAFRPYGGQARRDMYGQSKPSTYLVLSILVTIFCCVPFGIIGIVYASKVDSCWNNGLEDEARENSRKARNWALWGMGLVVLFYVIYLLLIALGVVAAFWTEDFFSSDIYDVMTAYRNF